MGEESSKALLNVAELEGISKADLIDRYIALRRKLAEVSNEVKVYKDKVQILQNQVIKVSWRQNNKTTLCVCPSVTYFLIVTYCFCSLYTIFFLGINVALSFENQLNLVPIFESCFLLRRKWAISSETIRTFTYIKFLGYSF